MVLEGEELILSDVCVVEATVLELVCLVANGGEGSFGGSVVSMGCTAICGVSVEGVVFMWFIAETVGERCCDCGVAALLLVPLVAVVESVDVVVVIIVEEASIILLSLNFICVSLDGCSAVGSCTEVDGVDTTVFTLAVAVDGVVGALETVFICSIVVFVGVAGNEETFVVGVLPIGDVMATAVVSEVLPVRFPPAAAFIMEAIAKIGFCAGDEGGGITVCCCCC